MSNKCKNCDYFKSEPYSPAWGWCDYFDAYQRDNAYVCENFVEFIDIPEEEAMVDIENVFNGEEDFELKVEGTIKVNKKEEKEDPSIDKLDFLRRDNEYLKGEIERLDKELKAAKEANEKLTDKNKKYKAKISSFYDTPPIALSECLSNEIKKLKEQLGDAEDYICELEERIRELEKENKTLINTVADGTKRYASQGIEVVCLRKDLRIKNDTLLKNRETIEKLEKERDRLKIDNRVIQERLDGIMSGACDGCAVCDRLSAAYDRLYEAYTRRTDEYKERKKECDKLKKENRITQEWLDGKQEDYNKLFDMFEKFKGEVNTWKDKYEFLTKEHGMLKNFTIDILNQVLHGVGKEIELFAFDNTPYDDMLDAVKDALRVNKIQQGLSDNFEKAYFDLKKEAERLESENMILRKQQVKAVHDTFFQNIYLSPPHIAALTDELYTQDLMLISLAEECSELAQVCTKSVKNFSLERGDIREMDAKLTEEVAHVLICIRGLAYCDAFGVCNFAKRVEEEIKKKWPDGYKD